VQFPEEPLRESVYVAQLSVVFVDDDALVLFTTASLLEMHGVVVRSFSNAAEALVSIAEEQPNSALLDINMPGMSGLELARRIRKLTGGDKLTLVALTANDPELDRQEAASAGFDSFFSKPARGQAIIAALSKGPGVPRGLSSC
jgi:CheY-like chemotaxis protein